VEVVSSQLILECQACIVSAVALLERRRGPNERRLEQLRTADRLRREAELPENGSRRPALLETARTLEERADPAPLRMA
jgi:hypothetical protein